MLAMFTSIYTTEYHDFLIIHKSEVNLPGGEQEQQEEGKEKKEEVESQDETNVPELVGGTSVIINDQRLKDMYKSVPRQVSVGYNYELVYATHRDGFSLLSLYGKMSECPEGPVWLLIRDNHHCVFGAYLSETIKESKNFYGSGYTYLISWYPQFVAYHWQGDNDFYMNGQRDFFSVGSGDGQFGLWLDGDLYRGRSQECQTFRNKVLTKEEDFCIVDLEVWRFTDDRLFELSLAAAKPDVRASGKNSVDNCGDGDGRSDKSLSKMFKDTSITKTLY